MLFARQAYSGYDFESSEEEDGGGILKKRKRKEKYKKKVRYFDLLPGEVLLPPPVPVIKHSPSDKSIFNVRIFSII